MGIKISELSPSTTLEGDELAVFVQDATTVNVQLSTVTDFLSGNIIDDASSKFAITDRENTFTENQTVLGALTAEYLSLSSTGFTVSSINNTIAITRTVAPDIGLNNVQIGYEAGSSASHQVAIGYCAGLFSGSLGVASDQVSIGSYAGYGVGVAGEAIGNVNIGTNTGRDIGTYGSATNTICMGSNAGADVSYNGIARDTIAIGTTAAHSQGENSTVHSFISIGTGAGRRAGSGSGGSYGNIAIGSNTAYSLGYYSLGATNNIIAIGSNAAYSLGHSSLEANENVIAIGSLAGYQAGQTGSVSNSIYIGFNTGVESAGQNNIFIGANTFSSTQELSNCIAIGVGARPSESNTIAIGGTTELAVLPGTTLTDYVSGLKLMVNNTYYIVPLLSAP